MNTTKTLTVFTPSYNRAHTLPRTYESLLRQTCKDFCWLVIDDGSTDTTKELVAGWISDERIPIEYIHKQNGGLYTGYNVAYEHITTELCVCIDSDDFMPDDAVEKILRIWLSRSQSKDYCGIVGLDYNVVDKKPIGGGFPAGVSEDSFLDIHYPGDTKQVMRTDLMKTVTPQIGFPGERDFNPFYMLMQILDKYPVIMANENFCWVEYQVGGDSMSQGIYKQYIRSPRSYAKARLKEMTLVHGNSTKRRMLVCAHYVSSCILSRDSAWLKKSPYKAMTLLMAPVGLALTLFIKWKTRN